MARKKKAGDPKKDLLAKIHDRYKIMTEADQDNRRLAMDDLKFVNEPGAQWDSNMKTERGDRPCYEFNKLRINGKKVINEIRANRPQGKVRAVEGGDKKTAELYEGLCRNIANMSDLDTITDNAAEYQIDAGMACWRVVTEYAEDDAFDQDILIKGIKNPFCLYADPSAQDPLKRDAEDWILTERISKSAFEAKYPKAERSSFDDLEFDDQDEWEDDETVRIAEYWYKEPYDKEIWLMAFPQEDGTVRRIAVDSSTDEAEALRQQPGYESLIERTRVAKCHKVMMVIVSGEAILEGPVEWAGSQFPFVMVFGEVKVIDGKSKWWGLHRFARDAQQSYNISRTAIDETIAGAPKEYFWATVKNAEGLTSQWNEAHKKNFPYKFYNPDPLNGGREPTRQGGAEVPVALIQQATIAAQDIRDVTGLHEASFGEESGEKSGIALARKQNQAQLVTYNFPDNMAKGIRRTWELLIDLIPHVYDAERELRVLGSDGAEDYVKVNQLVFDPAQNKTVRVNDLSAGKYDVAVTVGPSFSTMRQEAAEVYGELASKSPELMQVAGDLVFKALDMPYADQISKRWEKILPPPIQQMLTEGKDVPPEAQMAMAQAAQAMQMVQQQSQLVQAAAAEVQQDQAKSEKAKAEVNTVIANLKTQQAQFDAHVEREMAKIVKATADLTLREAQSVAGQAQQGAENDRESLSTDLQKAIVEIQRMAAEFQQQAVSAMADMMSKSQPQVVMMPSPRPKRIVARRVNGELVAEPQYEDMPMMKQ